MTKRIAIMQPYFFPYIGYFQLINAVDEFVIYDNIEFTKRGWINRNRILVNGKDDYISLPLKKDSDFLFVNQRFLSDSWEHDRNKIINKLKESYRKAPYFSEVFPIIEEILMYENKNLFYFILNSINNVNHYLELNTKLVTSSTLDINHNLKSEEKVIAICKAVNAYEYINPIGGLELYNKNTFNNNGINLQFLRATEVKYTQFSNEFLPWLSIIDVMMFNSKNEVKKFLIKNYILQ